PLVAEAEALEDPRRVVVEQNVGPTHQSGEDLAPGLALQVDRQAALVAVQGVKGAAAVRHCPGLVATPRLLDLDDVSTQVGQEQTTRRPSYDVTEFEHAKVSKR